jgi:hypothetical protein
VCEEGKPCSDVEGDAVYTKTELIKDESAVATGKDVRENTLKMLLEAVEGVVAGDFREVVIFKVSDRNVGVDIGVTTKTLKHVIHTMTEVLEHLKKGSETFGDGSEDPHVTMAKHNAIKEKASE